MQAVVNDVGDDHELNHYTLDDTVFSNSETMTLFFGCMSNINTFSFSGWSCYK